MAAAKCDVLRKWEVLGEKRATLFSADINEFSTYFLSFRFHSIAFYYFHSSAVEKFLSRVAEYDNLWV